MSAYWKFFKNKEDNKCVIIFTELTFETDSEIKCMVISEVLDGAESSLMYSTVRKDPIC